MIRSRDASPVTPAEFEAHLEDATQGIITSGRGLDPDTESALDDVTSDPTPSDIAAARAAYHVYQSRAATDGAWYWLTD